MRTQFDLGSESVVFDLGAYCGYWARAIKDIYDCRIHCFEPVPHHAARCRVIVPECHVHEYAVDGYDGEATLGVADDASSLYQPGVALHVIVKSISTVLEELCVDRVDLCKINIEGSEYALMESVIANGLMGKFHSFYIQFHRFPEGYESRYSAIESELLKTHQVIQRKPFVWEYWREKEA